MGEKKKSKLVYILFPLYESKTEILEYFKYETGNKLLSMNKDVFYRKNLNYIFKNNAQNSTFQLQFCNLTSILLSFSLFFFVCLFVLWCKKLGKRRKKKLTLLCEPEGRKIIKLISQGFLNYLYTAQQIDTLFLLRLPNLPK